MKKPNNKSKKVPGGVAQMDLPASPPPFDEKDIPREPLSAAQKLMQDAPVRLSDVDIDYMFTLGYRGVSLTEVADHYELSPREFRVFLSQNIDLYFYHAKGDTLRHNDYERSVEGIIKEKYVEKVLEGNVPAILWGMQNIVVDRQRRLLTTLKEDRPKPDLVEYAHLTEPERKQAVRRVAQALTQGLIE